MTHDERTRHIERYEAGYGEVVKALKGFPEELLTHHPFSGKWSAREIVHHLADSETTAAHRLRRLLTEEYPVVPGYDQDRWAILLRYNLREHAPALEAFRAARETTGQLLRAMTEDDWACTGWHTESGNYSAERWLQIYAEHAHNHADQITRLREALTRRS